MLASLRYYWTRFQLRRVMRPIDRQIATARRQHKPVAHLIAAKQALLHSGLEGAR